MRRFPVCGLFALCAQVVTIRTSKDGANWTQDWGCADAKQDGEHCKTFNTTAVVAPCDCPDDPPDLEFYRIRAFVLGQSGRVAAHALDYVRHNFDIALDRVSAVLSLFPFPPGLSRSFFSFFFFPQRTRRGAF